MNEISRDFVPPDELVQGVLVKGGISMLFGPSNSGKTFVALDLACAVARGTNWSGRKTEKNIAIYLAAESPNSVTARGQAYQAQHNCALDNLVIVDSPINLFSDVDVVATITSLVRDIENKTRLKVSFILGDTLAILSAGANENSGQDMGLVMANVRAIVDKTDAHFMLIHHTGKNLAANARGWSGIRAFVDTELELYVSGKKLVLEITKQRDLDSKGQKFGFFLKTVELGKTKFGDVSTTCVVDFCGSENLPERAPKKLGRVEKPIFDFIKSNHDGVTGAQIKHHFGAKLRQTVERALKTLVEKELVIMENERFISAQVLNLH